MTPRIAALGYTRRRIRPLEAGAGRGHDSRYENSYQSPVRFTATRALVARLSCVPALAFNVCRLPGRIGLALRRVIAPDYCAACDAPLVDAAVFCAGCGPCPAAPLTLPLDATAGGAYEPPLSTAILRLKFGQRTDLADRLSGLLPRVVLPPHALVVPVPLHLGRLVERGFNPPALLARRWCRESRAQFAPELLVRWRDTPHQSRLSREERARNVVGAFYAQPGAAGRHAVLLDDVITTGATLAACRQALYAAGVVHVTVMALAATP
jgi:ComF family protein